MKQYDHLKIEGKWQKKWEKEGIYHAKEEGKSKKNKKYYSLVEFPYPSGEGLHVGHPRPYIGMDVVSRKKRMEGYNVLYPIGWDAFGLPTENYAIKTGQDPRVVTKKNTDNFRKQIKSIGISFDWSREINTTDPKYYKWTQWLFLQFLKNDLAYKAKMSINWCPSCKIGLANEEVVNGGCERCGTPVEKREKEQWMLAITKYADRLDKDLDEVDYLPQIKASQRNWIGKSEGAEIEFEIFGHQDKIKVFTTRPDTIFGATYLVLAPEHTLLGGLKDKIENWGEVEQYISKVKKKTEIERTSLDKTKTGIELKGVHAINPATSREIPVWIADYVLATYGTGSIMAVPGHDERDFEFATKYNLDIKYVIAEEAPEGTHPPQAGKPFVYRRAVECYVRNPKDGKFLLLEWKKNTNWKTPITGGIEESEDIVEASKREIYEETGYKNLKFIQHLGTPMHAKFYHPQKDENRIADFYGLFFELENEERDEVSEGEQSKHDVVWVEKDKVASFLTTSPTPFYKIGKNDLSYAKEGILVNSGKFNSLNSEEAKKEMVNFVGGKFKTTFKLRDWVFSRQRYWGEPIPVVHCEKCGIVPLPEKDLPLLLPKVKNYQPTESGESPLALIEKWVNTKCPKCKGPGKRETDTMPNWAGSSWYFLRYTDPKNAKAFADPKKIKYWTPVDWYNGGNEHTTLHLLYSRFWHKFLYDLKLVPTSEPYMKRTSHGLILAEGGEKMSKSKGNVINPNDIVGRYGADSFRLYMMFMGPFEQAIAWSESTIIGSRRFLERVWKIGQRDLSKIKTDPKLEKLLHKTIKKVGEDIENMRFNTAVSAMMVLVNEMDKSEINKSDYKKFLQILSPFAPHLADEMWNALGEKKSINISKWPEYDSKMIKDEEVKIAVQINGKVRAEILVSASDTEEEVKKKALLDENVKKYTEGKEIKKVIYIKGRLINILL
ncbi:MAG: class I tRNA ligase family protein [Candidatus Paceibacterota bacterium]